MTDKNNKAKPDDRSDNAEKLQSMIQDTLNNIDESEETIEFVSEHERENIKKKNEKRREAIDGYRDEIKDEAKFRNEHDFS